MKATIHTPRSAIVALILLASATSSLLAAVQQEVFNESFNYANQAALMAVWTKPYTGGSTPNVATDANVPHSPYLVGPNAVIYRPLSQTITTSQDWTLTFDIIHTVDRRGGWVGLFNEAGTNGYVALWDSGGVEHASSSFSIRSYSSTTAPSTDNPALTSLPNGSFSFLQSSAEPSVPTLNPFFDSVTNNHFVTVTLAYDSAASTLTLSTDVSSDSAYVKTVSITGIDVSKVYIKGNANVYFDNIGVTATPVPEPGTVAVLAGAACLLATVLQRRLNRG
ncbi:hypothetical protein [Geminisphaera colitermitum]|uniref:hypothetical protein n=1 Tax=Geminisphaera colitermitum TaxID=1148786 RepID=UPI000158CAA1|nr:hypothetical protein [Geminisphaera colitermitum]